MHLEPWFLQRSLKEEAYEEYLLALDRLEEAQSREGHRTCPGTKMPPAECNFCMTEYRNPYYVWHLLMVVNEPVL